MTKVQTVTKGIIAHLHAADKELRKAMVLAGDNKVLHANMRLITYDILDSESHLDDALFRAEAMLPKKSSKKNLTFVADGL